jgi:hypothetical protein
MGSGLAPVDKGPAHLKENLVVELKQSNEGISFVTYDK